MGILGAFIIALLIALLFVPYRNRNSAGPLIIFFLVLFMAGIAAQFWIISFGPVIWGVSWLPTLFVVVIFALLFSTPPMHKIVVKNESAATDPAVVAISIFIWTLLFILAAAIVIGVYSSDSLNPSNKITTSLEKKN